MFRKAVRAAAAVAAAGPATSSAKRAFATGALVQATRAPPPSQSKRPHKAEGDATHTDKWLFEGKSPMDLIAEVRGRPTHCRAPRSQETLALGMSQPNAGRPHDGSTVPRRCPPWPCMITRPCATARTTPTWATPSSTSSSTTPQRTTPPRASTAACATSRSPTRRAEYTGPCCLGFMETVLSATPGAWPCTLLLTRAQVWVVRVTPAAGAPAAAAGTEAGAPSPTGSLRHTTRHHRSYHSTVFIEGL
jgi:hypothetical protein